MTRRARAAKKRPPIAKPASLPPDEAGERFEQAFSLLVIDMEVERAFFRQGRRRAADTGAVYAYKECGERLVERLDKLASEMGLI